MSISRKKALQAVIVVLTILVAIFAVNIHGINTSTTEHAHSASGQIQNQFRVHYIDDSENPLLLSQVSKLPAGMYADASHDLHSPDSLIFSVWYRISLKPDAMPLTSPLSITVDNPTLDVIDFYLVEQNKIIKSKQLGDTVYSENKLDYVVPKIVFYEGITHEQVVYIHVKTNGASASPILIEQIEDAQLRSSGQLLLLGCFIGVILIMMIYNFIMFRGMGDPSYFNYIGYIGFAGFTLSLINGFAFYVFPFEIARWFNAHLMVTHFAGLIFALTFAVSFLRFDKIKPWFVNLGVVASKVILAFALSGLFLSEATLTPFYFGAVLFVYVYVIGLMVMVVNTHLMWVRYYLLSWLPLFFGVGIGIAAFNGGVPYSFVTRNAALLGVLAEISIMAIALMDRFRANEVDKEYRINHDVVTGLPNKAALEVVLQKLTHSKKAFTLVLFEVPEANTIIPRLGKDISNQFYNQLLSNVETYTDRLSSSYQFAHTSADESCHVARVDEAYFALVFMGDLSDEALSENFLAIQEAVSTLINVNEIALSVSCNAGVVGYPSDTEEQDNLITLAFQALIGCSKSPHGWARYQQHRSENIRKRFELAAELQQAIDSDDLELFHHPKINLKTGEVVGSELLLRWNHNELGYVSAERIINVAEETGIVHHLTEWVITQGINQHAKLYRLGFNHNIAINLSSKDLTDNGLMAHILTTVAENLIPPESVVFELTESATLEHKDIAKQVITELHEQGFKVAIDDFGTGYSSLDYLSQLPFSELKVDKRFMNITKSPKSRAISEMSIALGRRLGVTVVAEGVEDEEVAQILMSLSCPVVQGYLYAKPMAFIDYMRWLQSKPLPEQE